MKTLINVCSLILLLVITACGNAKQINGHSFNTARKSVSFIKGHLPPEQRVEFEMAYWALREQIKDDANFLQTIDGKSAQDLIALAKTNFADQKEAGVTEYAAYDDWEDMLSQQIQHRKLQDRSAVDVRDKKGYPRVDYKLHSM